MGARADTSVLCSARNVIFQHEVGGHQESPRRRGRRAFQPELHGVFVCAEPPAERLDAACDFDRSLQQPALKGNHG